MEKRALTKSTYKDAFSSILKKSRKGLSEDIFIEINKRNFAANKYNILTLDIKTTTIKKYNVSKKQWWAITDLAKSGFGLVPDKKPQ